MFELKHTSIEAKALSSPLLRTWGSFQTLCIQFTPSSFREQADISTSQPWIHSAVWSWFVCTLAILPCMITLDTPCPSAWFEMTATPHICLRTGLFTHLLLFYTLHGLHQWTYWIVTGIESYGSVNQNESYGWCLFGAGWLVWIGTTDGMARVINMLSSFENKETYCFSMLPHQKPSKYITHNSKQLT